MKFNKGDKIIWDSFFGYELGHFICESDETMYNSYKVDMETGTVQGECLKSKQEVKPFNEETMKEMVKKYGREKTFKF